MGSLRRLMCLIALLSLTTLHVHAATQRPNVVIILADDSGWGDYSIHGNTNLKTPSIDSIAKAGALFDRFYVCPVCSPTRAEFLTGRYHPRGGVWNVSSGGERLNLDEVTIAQTFKAAGYATGAFGKWHNGTQGPYHPNARGFDEYYGFTSGHWGDYFDPPLDHNGKWVKGKGFIIDDLTDHAMQFIADHKDGPFFCYVPVNTPHTPMQVPDRFYDKFKNAPVNMRSSVAANDAAEAIVYADDFFDDELTCDDKPAAPAKKAGKGKGKKAGGEGGDTTEDIAATRAVLAMMENIDWNVGRILAKLDELKLADDTIVLYFSDNGPNTWRWNGSMRGKKGSTDEGGVRSPLFIRWPGHIQPGTTVKPVAGAIDLLPTLADLTGVPLISKKPLDGVSLKPLLINGAGEFASGGRAIFSHWGGKVSMRTQQYRLDAAGKLYDMVADGGQTLDIAAQQPDVAKRMSAAVEKWKTEVLAGIAHDDRALPIGYRPGVDTFLPARDGVQHGNIKRSANAPNCSYFTNWTSADDTITWDVEALAPGRYEAVVYYTCPAGDVGSTVELSFNGSKVQTKVTEPHDPPLYGMEHDRYPRKGESFVKDFKPMKLGTIDIQKGRGPLTLRPLDVKGKQVMEVRMVVMTLVP
jgi:arylsulfatase A-like enzyme